MYTVDIVAYDEASELDYWKPYFEVEKSQNNTIAAHPGTLYAFYELLHLMSLGTC